MRIAALLSLLAFTACTDSGLQGQKMAIDTPSFTLQPGEEKFYCYYTTLPNEEAAGIYHLSSSMTPGSHHMIVLKTMTPSQPDGTFAECQNFGMGAGGLTDIPVWLYAAQDPEAEYRMPDGVGLALAAHQPVIVNMHYINQSDAPLTANVHVDLEAFEKGHQYTQAHAFISFQKDINIPPNTQGSAGGTCDVPVGAQFVLMSTHSHRYTMNARVRDGDTTVLETLDWAHATVEEWKAPYYTFTSGKLDYRCEYNNTTNQPLVTGESAITNEMCMAVGVYFPAHGDTFCLNSFTITL